MKRRIVSRGLMVTVAVLGSMPVWADSTKAHSVVAGLMNFTTVEPASLLLLGTGLIVAAGVMRKRSAKRDGA